MNTVQILVAIAGILTVVSFIRPQWPLLAVAVLLLCVALFIGK